MTHDFKLGNIDLVVSYEEVHGDLELGTILMRTTTGYADVTELIYETSGYPKGLIFSNMEEEIKESLQEKPSHLEP